VPYNGGSRQSAPNSFLAWRTTLGCPGSTFIRNHPNGDRAEQGTGCAGNAKPILYSISGGHILYNQTTVGIADFAMEVLLGSGG
jgi:hypothetical protein